MSPESGPSNGKRTIVREVCSPPMALFFLVEIEAGSGGVGNPYAYYYLDNDNPPYVPLVPDGLSKLFHVLRIT